MNKKDKIMEAKQLLSEKIQPLTESEIDFIQRYRTPGGMLILRNPDQQEMETAMELAAKGVDIAIIKRRIYEF
jgi:hypothetical protein